jgi:GAF domain-containing protein
MALPDTSLRELIRLSGVVLAQDDLSSTLDEICRIAVSVVPGADGASITSFSDGRPVAGAASDQWSRALDEAQYEEHEGPCLDCAKTGAVYRVRDLTVEPRWPSYGPRAVERGVRAAVSLPMTADGRLLGALNLYAEQPDVFDAEAVSLGEVLAAHAGLASQVAGAFFHHRDLALQLREAMGSRAEIEQAKGILMGARRCTADEAFAVLTELSQRSNRKLREVARALVDETAGGSA